MTVLLHNPHRVRRGRLVAFGTAVFAVAFGGLALSLAQTYGLSPGDGGALRPLPERLRVAAIVLTLGLLPLIGMLVYLRRYLLRIVCRTGFVELTAIGVFSPYVLRVSQSQIVRTRYFEGYLALRGLIVHAPWINLHVAGIRLPFIADMQAHRVNGKGICGLSAANGDTLPALSRSRKRNRLAREPIRPYSSQ